MIDYLILMLAVTCFTDQFAFTKLFEKAVRQTMVTSLIMLSVTGLVGSLLFLFVGGFQVQISNISLFWASLLAIVMIPYYMIGIKVLSLGSLAIYSMFMMLGGMLVPFFYGIIFLKEEISICKVLGTVLLTVFIVLQAIAQSNPDQSSNTTTSKKRKTLFFVLCMIIFVINGLTGVIAKAHQISEGAVDEISFTVVSCALTTLFSIIMLPFAILKDVHNSQRDAAIAMKKKPILIMLLMGASAYVGSFLHLLAAAKIPASVQFPLVSGGVIVLSAIVSAVVFKEKLSKTEWLSIAGAFASTVLFAF